MIVTHSPDNLTDALGLLANSRQPLKIIAGGTDLMVLMNARLLDATEFLDIWGIKELRGISEHPDHLRIGSLTTFSQIIKSAVVLRHVPSLVAASRTVGAIQIQNRGTIGGNIVNASPAGDSLPVLAAFDAEVEVGSIRGTRLVGFNEFYTGYRQTVLAPDELVAGIRIPKLRSGERDFFWKVGTRRAQAISKTVIAAKARIKDGAIETISIGVGSVAPTVIRARQTEQLLTGVWLTPSSIDAARSSIEGEISPINDLRSTEHYRRRVTGNILAKFLRELAQSPRDASS